MFSRETYAQVHIRRSDKVVEAAANLELSDEALQQRIVAQSLGEQLSELETLRCRAWRMDAVFLCSDDAALKQRLERDLKGSLGAWSAGSSSF